MPLSDREEFQGWMGHPLTQEFLGLLGQRQRRLKDRWGSGTEMTPEQQAQAVLLGRLAKLRFSDEDGDQDGATIIDLMETGD